MSRGYGPGSTIGSIFRRGYIGLEEIIRRAVQTIGQARREVELFIKRVSYGFDTYGDLMAPVEGSTELTSDTMVKVGFVYRALAWTLVKTQNILDVRAHTARTREYAAQVFADTSVEITKGLSVFGSTLHHVVIELPVKGIRGIKTILLELLEDEGGKGQ